MDVNGNFPLVFIYCDTWSLTQKDLNYEGKEITSRAKKRSDQNRLEGSKKDSTYFDWNTSFRFNISYWRRSLQRGIITGFTRRYNRKISIACSTIPNLRIRYLYFLLDQRQNCPFTIGSNSICVCPMCGSEKKFDKGLTCSCGGHSEDIKTMKWIDDKT